MARSASIEVEKPYHEVLQTLSEGSVARSFDPYLDIDWDSAD
ncbi:diiron oxygenase, partial [Rhodococcus erythropolis]